MPSSSSGRDGAVARRDRGGGRRGRVRPRRRAGAERGRQARRISREPGARATTFTLRGLGGGRCAGRPGLRDAIGPSFEAERDGIVVRRPAGHRRHPADLPWTARRASFAGTATREELSGSFAAAVGDLSRFAALAGRPLAGQVDVKATGTATTRRRVRPEARRRDDRSRARHRDARSAAQRRDEDRGRGRAARRWLRLRQL